MTFAQWMNESPLTASEIAAALGVHRVTLYRYRAGLDMPRPPVVRRIEVLTGGAVTVADLHAAWTERQG